MLVGATTENPSFELNAALLSRCRVVVLKELGVDSLVRLLERALADGDRGLAGAGVEVEREALESLAQLSSGDARRALNLLELVVGDARGAGMTTVDAPTLERVVQTKTLRYDKSGEEHFNLISALHKSLRESDADAAVYWLARMLAAGEDPLYVARRMVRFASEDIGLADPQALPQTLAAWDTYHRLGSPEGELALAQAAIYLALAPKSNAAYVAYKRARRLIAERPAEPVPMSIRNAPTELMKDVGYGEGHVYAHDTEEGVGGMECLPEALRGERIYEPRKRGFERELGERIESFLELRRRARSR